MPRRTSTTGSELFIVDNSDEDWKVLRYLHDWCQISKALDCATGYPDDVSAEILRTIVRHTRIGGPLQQEAITT